jgi:RNA polymerase sigma-70 factor (ECF subfamily)
MPDAKKLFEALVREHADMLTVYLRSALGNVPEVEDLFQDAMVVAWRRIDDFDQTRPFGPWLRGIAKKLVQAHYRKQVLRPRIDATLERIEARITQLSSRPGDTWQEKLELLQGCVQKLPDTYQTVVVARYLRGQAIKQLAESLGLSTAAVKKRLQRARAWVLDCMERKLAAADLPA